MRKIVLLAGLLLSGQAGASGSGAPGPDKAEAECRKVREKIERLHARMRAGYRAKAGNRLAERLRELKKQRAKLCR